MSMFPQRCKVCGKRDKLGFYVPDEVWKAVVPEAFQNRVVCLGCFDALASERGIDYAAALDRDLHFAGDGACLTLRIITREEAPKC